MRNLEIKNNDCHAALAMTKSVQSGRSMIEMLGVLAIIGVLSVGGIAGYSKAMMKYRINKTIEQITLIAGNARTFFASQGNYAGLHSEFDSGRKIIQKAKLVPDEMLTLDADGKITSITDAFGYSVYIGSVDRSASGDDKAFYMSLVYLPEEACIELATHNWQDIDVMAVSVGYEAHGPIPSLEYTAEGCSGMDGDDPLLGCPNGATVSLPLPLEKVVDACARDTEVTIKFR
ncbi:MAG: hypothetical protein IKO06_00555 [Alphaproteobacteria bacterium]|nr:hypothetical protein [Alphaproteobacteria bacterium]